MSSEKKSKGKKKNNKKNNKKETKPLLTELMNKGVTLSFSMTTETNPKNEQNKSDEIPQLSNIISDYRMEFGPIPHSLTDEQKEILMKNVAEMGRQNKSKIVFLHGTDMKTGSLEINEIMELIKPKKENLKTENIVLDSTTVNNDTDSIMHSDDESEFEKIPDLIPVSKDGVFDTYAKSRLFSIFPGNIEEITGGDRVCSSEFVSSSTTNTISELTKTEQKEKEKEKEKAIELGYHIVYGDTDSIMIIDNSEKMPGLISKDEAEEDKNLDIQDSIPDIDIYIESQAKKFSSANKSQLKSLTKAFIKMVEKENKKPKPMKIKSSFMPEDKQNNSSYVESHLDSEVDQYIKDNKDGLESFTKDFIKRWEDENERTKVNPFSTKCYLPQTETKQNKYDKKVVEKFLWDGYPDSSWRNSIITDDTNYFRSSALVSSVIDKKSGKNEKTHLVMISYDHLSIFCTIGEEGEELKNMISTEKDLKIPIITDDTVEWNSRHYRLAQIESVHELDNKDKIYETLVFNSDKLVEQKLVKLVEKYKLYKLIDLSEFNMDDGLPEDVYPEILIEDEEIIGKASFMNCLKKSNFWSNVVED